MKKEITEKFLLDLEIRKELIWLFKSLNGDYKSFFHEIIKEDKYSSRKLLTHLFESKEEAVKIAIFAAEQVVDVFEYEYNNDKPRLAIESAKKWINNKSKKTSSFAYDSAYMVSPIVQSLYYNKHAQVAYCANSAYDAALAAAYDGNDSYDAAACAVLYAANAKNNLISTIIDYATSL